MLRGAVPLVVTQEGPAVLFDSATERKNAGETPVLRNAKVADRLNEGIDRTIGLTYKSG